MHNTSWFLRDLDSGRIARPYYYSDSLHQFVSYGFGGYPAYPAGQLRAGAEQLANFLIYWTQNGKWNGKAVLDSASIDFMTPSNIDLGFYTAIREETTACCLISYLTPQRKKAWCYLPTGELKAVSCGR